MNHHFKYGLLVSLAFLLLFHTSCNKSKEYQKKKEKKENLLDSVKVESNTPNRIVFAVGGWPPKPFIKYLAELTGKEKPKICFFPTAWKDSKDMIIKWYELCHDLDVEPHVLEVWIESKTQKESFDEIINRMDAVVVGGGNTLNMLAIWKAQGIDAALRKAYENGVIMAGGSAGSLCWFNGGTTDSRPKELSLIEGLAFIDYSHSPHYSNNKLRRPTYHKNILEGKLSDGYACDNNTAVIFINGKYHKSISLDEDYHTYYVYEKDGEIVEDELVAEIVN